MNMCKYRKFRKIPGWDPVQKEYVPINPVPKTVGTSCPPHSVIPVMPDMGWLGAPMSDREAAEYEIRRAKILKGNEP